jgi:uncharacterized protein YjbI with pentapeptide repeats
MRVLALSLLLALTLSSSAFAASYQQTNGTIVDPIQNTFGGNHPYSGIDLAPLANPRFADLSYAYLAHMDQNGGDLVGSIFVGADLSESNLRSTRLAEVDLTDADLSGSDLLFSNLVLADLTRANLTGVDLTGVRFEQATAEGADFSGAIFIGAVHLGSVTGVAKYDEFTDFTNAWDSVDRNFKLRFPYRP